MVQRRAARYVTNRFHNNSSVGNMLQHLNWPTLKQRRLRTRLIFFYKIIHNLVAIYPTDLLDPLDRRTRNSNPIGFQQIHTSKDTYKFSFYPRPIVQWNNYAPSSPSLHRQAGSLQRAGYNTCSSVNILLSSTLPCI